MTLTQNQPENGNPSGSPSHESLLGRCRDQVSRSVRLAGSRFTPLADVKVSALDVFDGLGMTASFQRNWSSQHATLRKAWLDLARWRNHSPLNGYDKRAWNGLQSSIRAILTAKHFPDQFRKLPLERSGRAIRKADKALAHLREWIDRRRAERASLPNPPTGAATGTAKSVSSDLQFVAHSINTLSKAIHDLSAFYSSEAVRAANTPALLVLGTAGIGKSHLFCRVARQRTRLHLPTLLFLGQEFRTSHEPGNALSRSTGTGYNFGTLLRAMDCFARKVGHRSLILYDAINEADRDSWRTHAPAFANLVRRYPGVALAISCRAPFHEHLFTDQLRKSFVQLWLPGFARNEQSAMKRYFRAYRLPLPDIPLITPEFSNPLILKLFCEAAATISKGRHRQVIQMSSGMRGMRYILETIVKNKGQTIQQKIGLHPGEVWKIIKDVIGAAMARQGRAFLYREECLTALRNHLDDSKGKECLEALVDEDLLTEDLVWDDGDQENREVVRFPYQKFGDYVVANHLLGGIHTESLHPDGKWDFGELFSNPTSVRHNRMLIESLLSEFPTRVKRNKVLADSELLDFVDNPDSPFVLDAFLESLYWREPDTFLNSQGVLRKSFLRHLNACLRDRRLREKAFDILVALATKPNHPMKARILSKFLRGFPMWKRDLFWSEFLRHCDPGSSYGRLVDWADRPSSQAGAGTHVEGWIELLAWALTSTRRPFRDRVTRAIYNLGRRSPTSIFQKTLEMLDVNDPYVPERMLAAAYGVAMAIGFEPPKAHRQRELKLFAQRLYERIFGIRATCATTHILARDYARHTIEIALHTEPNLLLKRQVAHISPPFKRGGIRRWGSRPDKDKGRYRDGNAPLGMDFENYTLGRLVRDRSPYDFRNRDYARIRGNLFWRIYKLGYSVRRFGEIDKEIARENWDFGRAGNGGKTDRYGKKYSWIAFFELAGYLEDRGMLPERSPSRISDVDLDPSFPAGANARDIVPKGLLGKDQLHAAEWIQRGAVPSVEGLVVVPNLIGRRGPWVCLHGFIIREDPLRRRGIFCTVNGMMIREPLFRSFVGKMARLKWWENTRLPEPEKDHYVYAGEIPWCETYPENGVDPENPDHSFKSEIELYLGTQRKKDPEGIKKIKRLVEVLRHQLGSGHDGLVRKFENALEEKVAWREIPRTRRYEVFVPVRQFSWESYHSTLNESAPTLTLAREISGFAKLSPRPQTFDLFDMVGRPTSISISHGNLWHHGSMFLYLRKDILDSYLRETGRKLVWLIEGERRYVTRREKERENFAKKGGALYSRFGYSLSYSRGSAHFLR